MTAVILHTITDAKHCIENHLHERNILFSTHVSVDVFLWESFGIKCQCLSAYLTTKEILTSRDTASELVNQLVAILDQSISAIINSRLGLKMMKWFESLYSYLGKHHLHGYICFVEAVKKIIIKHQIQEIIFYDIALNNFFKTTTSIKDFIPLLPTHVNYKIFHCFYPENRKSKYFFYIYSRRYLYILCQAFKTNPSYVIDEILNRIQISISQLLPPKSKKILFSDFSYNLKFLANTLYKKYRILSYNKFISNVRNRDIRCRVQVPQINIDPIDLPPVNDGVLSVRKILLKDISEDFQFNINKYISVILALKEFHEVSPISICVAGCPPIEQEKALCYEFFRSEEVKVIIGEHGCLYGESYEPWHFNSDFNRCDAFISYGFTNEDLKRMYPGKEIYPQIYSYGYISPIRHRKNKRPIDILFPMTNTISMFNAGMSRLPPDKLLHRQIKLLEYLNTLEDLNICIKLFPYSDNDYCAPLPLLKKLTNLVVVNDLSLTHFLESFHPKAVLIEYPSQPLTEVIGLDTEVFLIADDTLPYEEAVVEKLKMRVHYSTTIEDAIQNVERFFKGKLEKKRDASYYNHYVYKKNTKKNIVTLIDKFVACSS